MSGRSRSVNLLSVTLAAALANQLGSVVGIAGIKYLAVQAKLTVAGGGTAVTAWVQTSLDGGVTWNDIMCFSFSNSTAVKQSAVWAGTALAAGVAPTDGTLANNTILSGLIGSQLRVKWTSTGTFTGASTLVITGVASQ